jgi:hypothetical protein
MGQAKTSTSGNASSAPDEPLQASADPGIQIDRNDVEECFTLGGNCPVQATGLIDGEPFCFRARWSHWSLSIGSDAEDHGSSGVYGRDVVGAPRWYHEEDWGDGYEAGWMPEQTAREMIAKGASLYRDASAQNQLEERSDVGVLRQGYELIRSFKTDDDILASYLLDAEQSLRKAFARRREIEEAQLRNSQPDTNISAARGETEEQI